LTVRNVTMKLRSIERSNFPLQNFLQACRIFRNYHLGAWTIIVIIYYIWQKRLEDFRYLTNANAIDGIPEASILIFDTGTLVDA
jgi:hypothetical protein